MDGDANTDKVILDVCSTWVSGAIRDSTDREYQHGLAWIETKSRSVHRTLVPLPEELPEPVLLKQESIFNNSELMERIAETTRRARCTPAFDDGPCPEFKEVFSAEQDDTSGPFITASKKLRDEGGFLPKTSKKQKLGSSRGIDRSTTPSYVKKAFSKPNEEDSNDVPEELQGIDLHLIELINHEIMDKSASVCWSDIAGLEFAKKSVMEIVIWPLKRPDIFKGLRGPPKGILLFGPPGTGKTMIGKAIAGEAGATFFSISASSLTSKWHGEGEKLVKTLFAVARLNQPAVIFIDEIDSLLSQRNESEFEGSRRLKTEFLIQLDGAKTNADERILVVGATNRPQELDEAARRRLVKRLYIPLPDRSGRVTLLKTLLSKEKYDISDIDLDRIVSTGDGYSGADLHALCREAAYGPIRDLTDSLSYGGISGLDSSSVGPITYDHFMKAFKQVKASVSQDELQHYVQWNALFGSF